MAERRTARGKQDLTPDELAPAPDESGGALTIVGVLGDSPDADSVRLFLDAQFQTYYEIPREAILRRTRVPAERSPLGVDCSAVVVARGTELTVHRAVTRRVEEEFLAGDFTAAGTFTPRSHGVGTQQQPPGPSVNCGSALCITDALTCPPTGRCITFGPNCPVTRDPGCQGTLASNCCFTSGKLCGTKVNCPSQAGCPSDGAGCPSTDVCGGSNICV
jgi:hypothetical protein